ncbi:MAG TPA: hypothetical protein VM677_03740 [Actinokineospora sp.]|nr:hypothetical protein [Actinokineospora sp.]
MLSAVLAGSLVVTAVGVPVTAQAVVPPGVSGSTKAPMGWSSWYFYNNDITAKVIADQAAGLAKPNANLPVNGSGGYKSLSDLGYKDVGIDGGWWTSSGGGTRAANGTIIPDTDFLTGAQATAVILSNGTTVPARALNTMKDLTDYIHALGLEAGMYTDTGVTWGCGGQRGSGNYEAKDLTTFADWGFDWVKVDHCGGTPSKYGSVMANYKDWGTLAANTKTSAGVARPLGLEFCQWGSAAPDGPWMWAGAAARTWRTGRDISGNAGWGTTSNGGATWINWSQVKELPAQRPPH